MDHRAFGILLSATFGDLPSVDKPPWQPEFLATCGSDRNEISGGPLVAKRIAA